MRVLVAGFKHETNTFARDKADWAAFERGEMLPAAVRGNEMLEVMERVAMPASGFLRYARQRRWEVVPSLWCGAVPSAHVTAQAFDHIRRTICEDVRRGGFDAIYLDLHGAGVAETEDDTEGALIGSIRAIVGADVPIVASLDLHANVTARMLADADAMVSFRTYPHVDYVETGALTGELLHRRLQRSTRETLSWSRLPFLIPINSQNTTFGFAKDVYDRLVALDADLGTISSFCMGFPAADFDECAPMIWSVGERGAEAVEALRVLAEQPERWRLDVLDADAAVASAMRRAGEDGRALVIIADTQDNPGAGGTASTTGMLHALLRAGAGLRFPDQVALGVLCDPTFAAQAVAAGVGGTFEGQLGEVTQLWDGPTDPPVSGRYTVRAVSDGDVTFKGPKMTGFRADLGPSAAVEIDGVLVVVASGRIGAQDRELFRFVGIQPENLKIITVKSSNHFRADFARLVRNEERDILIARARGIAAVDPGDLPWRKLPDSIRRRP